MAADPLAKREQILDAALEVFVDRGYYGTAVPQIAERAGVAVGSLYRYYDSKEALVNALYQRWKQAMADALLADFPADMPVRQMFHELWQRSWRFVCDHPAAYAFLELHHHAPYLDDKSREVEQRMVKSMLEIVRTGQRQGVLKPLTSEIVLGLLLGAFGGLARAAQSGGVPVSEEDVAQAEQCLWEAVRC